MSITIGVDIGGTKVLAAEVLPDGTVARTARRSTPGRLVPVEVVEDALTEAVLEVADGRRIDAVGLAAAGFVDAAGEKVMFAPHLPWRLDPARARLELRWGVPVALDNDANCAARAEFSYGVARGHTDVVMVNLGTGIGGGIVLGGTLMRGHNGMAGEFGHMQVVPDGRECECGRRGCWEQYCSGNALVREFRRQGGAEGLTGPMITEAAQSGDRLARAAFDEIGRWLGVGLANLTAAFDPELVVVGGGVSAAGDLLLGPAVEAFGSSLVGAEHRDLPDVRRARFLNDAGVIGAADMARTEAIRPMFRRRRGELVKRARRRERLRRFLAPLDPAEAARIAEVRAARRRPRGRRAP
ncbi:ROK family protein [Nocardioides sp. Kera G14]|uniref:ROK family protein n=1 Tax=Nocardioides sp. Kera G14 TaxID=2884264 RepID=UPI001D1041D9|nr:ROK family protein [Nocardioides sp. Kera G14]UDY22517.1 ROK family protein [Nocardioides sp. Kera G14]